MVKTRSDFRVTTCLVRSFLMLGVPNIAPLSRQRRSSLRLTRPTIPGRPQRLYSPLSGEAPLGCCSGVLGAPLESEVGSFLAQIFKTLPQDFRLGG